MNWTAPLGGLLSPQDRTCIDSADVQRRKSAGNRFRLFKTPCGKGERTISVCVNPLYVCLALAVPNEPEFHITNWCTGSLTECDFLRHLFVYSDPGTKSALNQAYPGKARRGLGPQTFHAEIRIIPGATTLQSGDNWPKSANPVFDLYKYLAFSSLLHCVTLC